MDRPLSRRNVMVGAVATAAASILSGKPAQASDVVVHEVTIKRFRFSPMHVKVSVGDTIRWTNKDLAPHTATANELGWDTGEIVKDASVDVVVTQGMETAYFCAFHPHMKGEIVIT